MPCTIEYMTRLEISLAGGVHPPFLFFVILSPNFHLTRCFLNQGKQTAPSYRVRTSKQSSGGVSPLFTTNSPPNEDNRVGVNRKKMISPCRLVWKVRFWRSAECRTESGKTVLPKVDIFLARKLAGFKGKTGQIRKEIGLDSFGGKSSGKPSQTDSIMTEIMRSRVGKAKIKTGSLMIYKDIKQTAKASNRSSSTFTIHFLRPH